VSKPKAILPLTIEATLPDDSPAAAWLQIRGDDAKLVLVIPHPAAALLTLAADQLVGQALIVTIAIKE